MIVTSGLVYIVMSYPTSTPGASVDWWQVLQVTSVQLNKTLVVGGGQQCAIVGLFMVAQAIMSFQPEEVWFITSYSSSMPPYRESWHFALHARLQTGGTLTEKHDK